MKTLDDQLRDAPAIATAGPPSEELEALVREAKPRAPRRPAKDLMVLLAAAVGIAGPSLVVLGLRDDFSGLSLLYRGALALAWLVAVMVVGAVALLPRSGSALPRGRVIATVAFLAGLVFIAIGLAWTEAVPGHSHLYEPGAANVARWAPYCLSVGTVASLAVVLAMGLLLFRAFPIGSAWVGAGIGAAGGCLGGLILHFHCDIAMPSHFGLVHGGVVLIATALGALLLPRATEMR